MIPDSVRPLLPLAEVWGIGDDTERWMLVKAASPKELRAMIAAVDSVPDDDLYGWLSGPESYSPAPSSEYLAITCLTMAADHGRVLLRKLAAG